MDKKHSKHSKQLGRTFDMLLEKLIPINHIVVDNYGKIVDIEKYYTKMLEEQKKRIAELKKTQAPEAVVETIDIVNEWLNGEQGV